MNFLPCAGHEHVESPPAAGATQGAEATIEFPVLVRAVGRADDDVIALIALNILQVLDEETLVRFLRESIVKVRRVLPTKIDQVLNKVGLSP